MFDLSPHPVQPPYWDPESQQYFHCYGYDSNHASPARRKTKSPARTSPSALATTSTGSVTGSPAAHQKRSPPQGVNPLTAQLAVAAAAAAGHSKKLTDYSNIYLPQAPKVKSRLLESVNASSTAAPSTLKTAGQDVENKTADVGREKEDILEVMQDKEDNFQVILNKNIPKIRTPPDNDDDDVEGKRKLILAKSSSSVTPENQTIMSEKQEILAQIAPTNPHGEEKHFSEVN